MTNTTMTTEQMMAEIEALRRANANLSAKKAKNSLRVSEKGAVSAYGLGRFPVTLYAEQWTKLNAMMPEIMAFIETNKPALATKSDAGVN